MGLLPQMWCPQCCEWTVLIDTGRCLWCSRPLQHNPTSSPALVALPCGTNGGRPWIITPGQAREAHAEHVAGRSLTSLAGEHWQTWGYGSSDAARRGLAGALRALGLPVRSRADAVRLAHPRRTRSEREAA